MKNFIFYFYLPKLDITKAIAAKDEATAVWKLLNQFRLRESEIDDYQLIKQDTWAGSSVSRARA